jgi:PhnB protein
MSTILNPYLSFRDNARQAMEFYQSVFGGELRLSTFDDFQASQDPAEKDKIMHGMLVTDGGLTLMGADTPSQRPYTPGDNFSVSLSGEDEDELRRFWEGISAGGTVLMPLEPSPWGDVFGMCTDRFGVSWLFNINAA